MKIDLFCMKKIWIGKKIELFIRSAYNKREKTGRTDRKNRNVFGLSFFLYREFGTDSAIFYIRGKKYDDTEN